MSVSGKKRKETITRPRFFADPVWDELPSIENETASSDTSFDEDQEESFSIEEDLNETASNDISFAEDDKGREEFETSPGMEDRSFEEDLNYGTSNDTSPAEEENENISSAEAENENISSAEAENENASYPENEKENTSSAKNDKDQEETERTEDCGDFHINATLPSLKKAVQNGLLEDAFRVGVDENEDIETSDDDEEAFEIAYKAKEMFRKNFIATSTSPLCKKLVKNSTL